MSRQGCFVLLGRQCLQLFSRFTPWQPLSVGFSAGGNGQLPNLDLVYANTLKSLQDNFHALVEAEVGCPRVSFSLLATRRQVRSRHLVAPQTVPLLRNWYVEPEVRYMKSLGVMGTALARLVSFSAHPRMPRRKCTFSCSSPPFLCSEPFDRL